MEITFEGEAVHHLPMFWQLDVPKISLTRQLCGIIFTSSAPLSLIHSSSGTSRLYISKHIIYIARHRQHQSCLVQDPPAMQAKSYMAVALLLRGGGSRQKGC